MKFDHPTLVIPGLREMAGSSPAMTNGSRRRSQARTLVFGAPRPNRLHVAPMSLVLSPVLANPAPKPPRKPRKRKFRFSRREDLLFRLRMGKPTSEF